MLNLTNCASSNLIDRLSCVTTPDTFSLVLGVGVACLALAAWVASK